MSSGTFYTVANGDDGQRDGATGFSITSSTTYLGRPGYKYFIRFNNLTIPQGTEITSAFVRYTAFSDLSQVTCNDTITFNDVDNAVAPTTYQEFDALVHTSESADWDNVGAWTHLSQYDSIDITAPLQEIVNRSGWSSGNAATVIGVGSGTVDAANRLFITRPYGSDYPELHVTWSDDKEVVLTESISVASALQSNIQVEIVPGVLGAESSLSGGDLFWGSFIECPSPFAATSTLQAKTGLEVVINPIIAQTNLKSNLQIELVTLPFAAQSELSVGEIFWGYEVDLPEPFLVNALLHANTQIELTATPLIATSALLSNIGIEISAGVLNNTGAILGTPVYPIILTGAKRIYLFTLTGAADGVDDITIPIKSFQSRLKSGDPTYLSVVIPGTDYASEINLRLNGDLVVRMGYLSNSEIILSEIISIVDFENIIIYDGTTNKTITLDGHRTETFTPKEINLTGSSYKNLTAGKLRYRCTPNLYVRPGDTVNIDNDSFTIENITYSVSPELETFEVSE